MKRLILALVVVATTVFIWLPFLLKMELPFWKMDFTKGSTILWQNYDGPNYMVVEKTWYNKADILNKFSNPLPAEYYPAHFPLYPAIIYVMDIFIRGPWAMLLSTLIGTVLCFLAFYRLVKEFDLSANAKWLMLVFLILPARWVAVRTIGSPEPWFIFFILSSIYYFKKENYWLAGGLAALAQLTKSPAILLFGAYGLVFITDWIKSKKLDLRKWPLLLQLIVIPGLFWFYGLRTGDFWAYFHSGDNIHLFWPPFSIFSPLGQNWVGSFWLEDIIWTWLIFGLGIMKLRDKKLTVEYYFSLLYFVSTLFVAHRDISRYILPIAPLVLIGWDEVLQRKETKIVLAILVIPIILFSWNFMLNNIAPIADWAPYL